MGGFRRASVGLGCRIGFGAFVVGFFLGIGSAGWWRNLICGEEERGLVGLGEISTAGIVEKEEGRIKVNEDWSKGEKARDPHRN